MPEEKNLLDKVLGGPSVAPTPTHTVKEVIKEGATSFDAEIARTQSAMLNHAMRSMKPTNTHDVDLVKAQNEHALAVKSADRQWILDERRRKKEESGAIERFISNNILTITVVGLIVGGVFAIRRMARAYMNYGTACAKAEAEGKKIIEDTINNVLKDQTK